MTDKNLRVLITGGGTGGHIYPGIVIANEILRLAPDAQIKFVGSSRGLEKTVVPRQGFEIDFVDVQYFVRGFTPKNIVTAYKALTAILAARRIIKKFKPDVVVGTGGYVSGPVVMAAALAKVPTLIHEQNAFPGLTTRLLASRVSKVAVSHAEAVKRIKSGTKIVVTGHPVRREFLDIDAVQARQQMGLAPNGRLVLVVGGSGGAEKLNSVAVHSASSLLENPDLILLHVTGNRYFNWVNDEKRKLHLSADAEQRYQLVDYLHDMPTAMAACDLIVARSGGMVHEMTAAGCPALLIPSPNVTDDHQLHNAKAMAKAGAALLVEESNLTAENLSEKIRALLDNPAELKRMAQATAKLGRPEAGHLLAKIIVKMSKETPTHPWG